MPDAAVDGGALNLRRVLLAAGMLAATPAWAQREDEQLWLQVNANVPVADRWRVTLEGIARFGDRPDGLFQTEFGALLGYRVSPTVELDVGYRRVGFYNEAEAPDEDRLRQQVVAIFGRVSTRLRLDERFRRSGDEVGIRLRPLVRYNHPLGAGGTGLFASHESFFLPNTTRWGQRRGYERMRNIVGVTLPLGRRLSADVGYLNQYRLARGGARAQMDHALTVQLTFAARSAPSLDD